MRIEDDDQSLIARAEAALGTDLPEACIPGVIANLRLLAQHWHTLREAAPE